MRESTANWQKVLANGFKNATDLLTYLGLPTDRASQAAEASFATRVPQGFAKRMVPQNPRDPLLLQVLASFDEINFQKGYGADPLQERHYNPVQGLIHKYRSRVLLTLTGACAINCRYCFRRHFPYHANNPGREGWQAAIDYIASQPDVDEVIFSGGDPLLASDRVIADLLGGLAEKTKVKTIRFHSRIPIVLPERVDAGFLTLFTSMPFQKVMVVHCNHPNELDEAVYAACLALKDAGYVLLNQSVLLKGVNDDPHVLAALSRKLFQFGILPYYLHLLDKVQGAAHFDLPLAKAKALHLELQKLLPGYLVPKLAQEIPGVLHKTLR